MSFEDLVVTHSMQSGLKLRKTKDILNPHYYVMALTGEFSSHAYDEERAPKIKGQWRKEFGVSPSHPLDLEIGTGNGYFYTHQASIHPERSIVGIELKYKPLIQSIRRALGAGCKNARIIRYDARNVLDLFAPEELDNVFLHHPDPWLKRRQNKNRLVQLEWLEKIYTLQKPGTFLEFKTDSLEYFEAAMKEIEKSPYKVDWQTKDLHSSEISKKNFITHFENIFIRQGVRINYALLRKIDCGL